MNEVVDRRQFLALGGGLAAVAVLGLRSHRARDVSALTTRSGSQDAAAPELFGGFPRAFIFRQSEVLVDELPYDEWEARMLALNGIMGKIVDEERPYGPSHMEYFLTFKQRHPEKAVFLHLNGRARRPSYQGASRFFAGHWLYRAGTSLTQPATAQDTVLHVQNAAASILPATDGAFNDRGPDIGIALPGGDGRPDWSRAEQVKLIAVDRTAQTVTVERGAYGTAPLDLPAGSYLATHVIGGPFSPPSDPRAEFVWDLNYSTACPRDAAGRNCIDAVVEDIVALVGPDGSLAALDGVELDSFAFVPREARADVNNDGVADDGTIDGIDTFGIGTVQIADALRARLGPDKIIIVDDNPTENPDVRVLNGAEQETWRSFVNSRAVNSLALWSTSLNLYSYWAQNSFEPRITYTNHKPIPKMAAYPIDYPFFRGVAAATQMTGVDFSFFVAPGENPVWTLFDILQPRANSPANPPPYTFDIYDELVAGTDQRLNWLGSPVSAARRLALDAPDLLDGQGVGLPNSFIDGLEGNEVVFSRQTAGGSPRLVVSRATPDPRAPLDQTLEFTLPNVSLTGTDLVVAAELQADPIPGYPDSISRELTSTVDGDTAGAQTGFMNNSSAFFACFSFRGLEPGQHALQFVAQGGTPVTLQRLTVHAAPDVMFREFQHGVVFANPSSQPYTFDVSQLLPGLQLRRLQGSAGQDPDTNNGAPIGTELAIPGNDALFTLKR